jgi:hypothetical protein
MFHGHLENARPTTISDGTNDEILRSMERVHPFLTPVSMACLRRPLLDLSAEPVL